MGPKLPEVGQPAGLFALSQLALDRVVEPPQLRVQRADLLVQIPVVLNHRVVGCRSARRRFGARGNRPGSIQISLVLADEAGEPQRRIDRLLAADAERKVGALRPLLASKRQAYAQKLRAAMPQAEPQPSGEAGSKKGDAE